MCKVAGPPAPGGPVVFNKEELACIRETRQKLTDEHELSKDSINLKFLAYVCVVSKNRADEAAAKYMKFLEAIEPCGLTQVEDEEDMWSDKDTVDFLKTAYQPTGLDENGCSIMWIKRAQDIPSELSYIRAGILYIMAIHADAKSLREGTSLCINVSGAESDRYDASIRAKLQKIDQSYPTRSQVIMIAGASTAIRLVVNGLIKVASLFTKQKILDRITFVTVEQAVEAFPPGSAPVDVGGNGGGIDDIELWVKERLASFPMPDLDAGEDEEFEA